MKKLAICAAVSLLLVACGGDNKPAQSAATDSANTAPKIRIATETSFKPFSYLDTQGNPIGFEIDLANALCAQMQADCQIIAQDWDSLIPGLNAQKFDAIMSGMSATEERKQVVDFSEPYFNNFLVLVAKKDNPSDISQVDGKSVAVQQATVASEYLAKNYPKADVRIYDKQVNAYLDLTSGRVEFMLSDIGPMSDWLSTENGQGFAVKGAPIDIDDKVAIALRKDDPLKEQFNAALAALKQNGEYDKLVAQYFDLSTIDAIKQSK